MAVCVKLLAYVVVTESETGGDQVIGVFRGEDFANHLGFHLDLLDFKRESRFGTVDVIVSNDYVLHVTEESSTDTVFDSVELLFAFIEAVADGL